jgi:hypothetical protein
MPRLLRLSDVRQTAIADAPPGYRLALVGRLHLHALGLLSLIALIVAAPLFILISAPLGGPIDPRGALALNIGPLDLLLSLIVAGVVLPVLHEAIHGLAALLVGGRPSFGIVLPVAAFCHFERFVSRAEYAFVLIAPLALLSIAGLALMPLTPAPLKGQLLLLLILNASGAVGDLAMLWRLRAAPPGALIADTATGFEAYRPDQPGKHPAP